MIKKLIATNGLVALAYFFSAKLGLQLALVGDQVTPLWPPTGIALVALLIFGWRKTLPGIAAGAFVVNVGLSPNLLATGMVTIGNTLAPLVAFLALKKLNFRAELGRIRDALTLIVPGALGSMMISATFGTTTLVASNDLGREDFWSTWLVWWTGDAMGVLIVAPVLMLLWKYPWSPRHVRHVSRKTFCRCGEYWVMLAGAATATVLATWTHVTLTFLVTPFILWAAFRYQLAGVAPVGLLVSVLSTIGVTMNGGPFEMNSLFVQMLQLQLFTGAVALTGLLLSALIMERDAALWQVVRGNKDLGDMMGYLSHGRLTNLETAELEEPSHTECKNRDEVC